MMQANATPPSAGLPNIAALPDEDLLALIARRCEDAFEALYGRHKQRIYIIALQMIGDRHMAEEVVQDVFYGVWQAASGFQPGLGTGWSWLTGIARHRAIDVLRTKRERMRRCEQALDNCWFVRDTQNLDQELTHRQLCEEVCRALQSLPMHQRQAIELAYYQGMTRAEIAAALDEPIGTIKTRMRLGLLKLRDALQPFLEEDTAGSTGVVRGQGPALHRSKHAPRRLALS